MLGLWEKVREISLVELLLSDNSSLQQSFSCGIEGSVEKCQECGGIFGKNVFSRIVDRTKDGDTFVDSLDVSHLAGFGGQVVHCE